MIKWIQGNDWSHFGDPFNGGQLAPWWTVHSNYGSGWQNGSGWFHVYAFTMTMGIILAVLISAWKFYKKDISLYQLAIGVIIIVPCSLFGASIFGKLNADGVGHNANGAGFWGLFAFWKAGMAIHGGVYVGVAVGVIVYGIMGIKTKVSLWTYMDAIIPNILIGQALGRWGNFFNHEVVGAPVGLVGMFNEATNTLIYNGNSFLNILPHYILVNTQFVYTGATIPAANGMPALIHDGVYQMAPIFFYESISLLIAWGLITFVIPNIGKWFGPKPWKIHSDEFKFSWKETLLNIIAPWKFLSNAKLDKATRLAYDNVNGTFNPSNATYLRNSWWAIWKQAYFYNPNYDQREQYEKNNQIIKSEYKNKTAMRYQYGKNLARANNPDRYWTTKVGCEASAYFFFWNLVRFSLEVQRPEDHLFIMYEKGLSLALIGATGLLGLIGMIMTQNIAVWFARQPGYQYEKQYFAAEKIDKEFWNPFKGDKTPIKIEQKQDLKMFDEVDKTLHKETKLEQKIIKDDSIKEPLVNEPNKHSKSVAELKAQAKLEKLKSKQNKNK